MHSPYKEMNHKMRKLSTNDILNNLKAPDAQIVDQAFTYLYQEYYPVVQSFIRNNSGSDEDAADIFQDALIVLYEKVRTEHFKLTCTTKTFIYSICKNLWLKKLNRRKQHLTKKANFTTTELAPNIADILEVDEQSELVSRLLKKLGEDGERILIYYYFDGLDAKEITKKMGYANEYVTRNKKFRSLKKLRTLLAQSVLFKDLLY